MKKATGIMWGVVLIALGLILGVNALGIADINIFFPGWWTLFIIVPSLISLFTDKDSREWDLICLVVGVCLLLACQGVIDFGMLWKLLVPAILIILGLSLIFKDALKKEVRKEMKKFQGKSNGKEYWATFAGQNLNFKGEKFEGGRMEAVFGGIKCDLTGAEIKEDVFVRASAVFGGVTMIVPDNINVKVISNSLFGGVTNKHEKREFDEQKKTLYVDATAIFGGVEIK